MLIVKSNNGFKEVFDTENKDKIALFDNHSELRKIKVEVTKYEFLAKEFGATHIILRDFDNSEYYTTPPKNEKPISEKENEAIESLTSFMSRFK